MNRRPRTTFALLVAACSLVAVFQPGLDPGAQRVRTLAADVVPASPAQDPCGHLGGFVRIEAEGFEDVDFPSPDGLWSITAGGDDLVTWGRRTCEAASGAASLWSVGGGNLGRALNCAGPNKDYPDTAEPGSGVSTMLRYGPIDLDVIRAVGIRVSFDYLARSPESSLLVGVGDLNSASRDGTVNYMGFTNTRADTSGEWVRDHIVGCAGDEFDSIIAGFERRDQVLLAFFYRDPAPGSAMPGADFYGTFIDNLRIDIKMPPRPSTLPSPTETGTVTATSTATVAPVETATPEPGRPTPSPTILPIVSPAASPTPPVHLLFLPLIAYD